LAWIGDRNGSSGNEIGQSPPPGEVVLTGERERHAVSRRRRGSASAWRARPASLRRRTAVLRPGLLSRGSRPWTWCGWVATALCTADGRGPTRVSTSKLTGIGIRVPQCGQNRCPTATCRPHLVHAASSPLVVDAGPGAGAGGISVPGGFPSSVPSPVKSSRDRGRGSSATAAPQRVHCGTPIGVSALHASQTRPTSIKPKFYPLTKNTRQRRRPPQIEQDALQGRSATPRRGTDGRIGVGGELAAPLVAALVLERAERPRRGGADLWDVVARQREQGVDRRGDPASAWAIASRTKLDASAAVRISAAVSPRSPSRPSARAASRRSPQLRLASALTSAATSAGGAAARRAVTTATAFIAAPRTCSAGSVSARVIAASTAGPRCRAWRAPTRRARGPWDRSVVSCAETAGSIAWPIWAQRGAQFGVTGGSRAPARRATAGRRPVEILQHGDDHVAVLGERVGQGPWRCRRRDPRSAARWRPGGAGARDQRDPPRRGCTCRRAAGTRRARTAQPGSGRRRWSARSPTPARRRRGRRARSRPGAAGRARGGRRSGRAPTRSAAGPRRGCRRGRRAGRVCRRPASRAPSA